MEYQVLDRLSFQRFLGLRRSSQVPDRTTFWSFHERLTVAKAGDTLFAAVNRQLAQHGYIARGGQIVDAGLVPVPRQHVTEKERERLKEQAMPMDWKPAQRRQKDTEATWTKKHGKSYFGYKVSVSTDRRYKLIRKVKVSTASDNDTLHLEDVLDHANTGRDLDGDKGYVDGGRERRLNAALKQMGGKLLRCIGLERATFHLTGKAAVYNLRRLCGLKACGVVAF